MAETKEKQLLENQISAWKSKYGAVFYISCDGKEAYLKKPDRATIGMAMAKGRKDPLASVEVILHNCWLEGDEELKTDPEYLLAIADQVDEILGAKKAEVKKL